MGYVPEREYYIKESMLRQVLEAYYRHVIAGDQIINESEIEEYIENEIGTLEQRSYYK